MPDLNAEAEKWLADHEEEWLLEHCDKDLMREAMRFAYADAARVCDKQRRNWSADCPERFVIDDCIQAIRARASKSGAPNG